MKVVPAGLLVAAIAIASTAACGGGAGSGRGSGSDGAITVSAAASLREAFTEIAGGSDGLDVTFNFDSSSSLASQLEAGAPADVFASADQQTMARLADAGVVVGPGAPSARNELVIVTQPGNPEGIGSLADLTDAGVVSLCGREVPCGRYAAQALAAAETSIPEGTVSRGQNARATLTAVADGDAAAGIVYATDAASVEGSVDVVALPADVGVTATYVIAVVGGTGRPDVAAAFLDRVCSPAGQAVLEEHGFLPPA